MHVMRVLIIKLSSLGDIIHTLPALTDAQRVHPNITFDWLVEKSFSDIPAWHPAVNQVIPVSLREMKKNLIQSVKSGALSTLKRAVRQHTYDHVIDGQGLIKSALITRFLARGDSHGFDRHSIRERPAAWFYRHRYSIPYQRHAIDRTRQLFSDVLAYPYDPNSRPDFGPITAAFTEPPIPLPKPYILFLHGTTWTNKKWPLAYWRQLVECAIDAGYHVLLPWGNAEEHQNATTLANGLDTTMAASPIATPMTQRSTGAATAVVLPRLSLAEIGTVLAKAAGVVSVDTGLGHLAAALGRPMVSLYGPTNPARVAIPNDQHRILAAQTPTCAPCLKKQCSYTSPSTVTPACFTTLSPGYVWEQLAAMIACSAKAKETTTATTTTAEAGTAAAMTRPVAETVTSITTAAPITTASSTSTHCDEPSNH